MIYYTKPMTELATLLCTSNTISFKEAGSSDRNTGPASTLLKSQNHTNMLAIMKLLVSVFFLQTRKSP